MSRLRKPISWIRWTTSQTTQAGHPCGGLGHLDRDRRHHRKRLAIGFEGGCVPDDIDLGMTGQLEGGLDRHAPLTGGTRPPPPPGPRARPPGPPLPRSSSGRGSAPLRPPAQPFRRSPPPSPLASPPHPSPSPASPRPHPGFRASRGGFSLPPPEERRGPRRDSGQDSLSPGRDGSARRGPRPSRRPSALPPPPQTSGSPPRRLGP